MRRIRTDDLEFIRRCIELAGRGALWVTPNPMVGCVIVKGETVIAEAFHERFGGPHAEVLALRQAGGRARGATMYVSLEPCSHYGKTPPCTEAIIHAGIRRVVAATKDPNPLVSGKGFRVLREAGIEVQWGFLADEVRQLNECFFHFMRAGLPFVGIKIAQTLDGNIADARGTSQWITGEEARAEGHRLRARYHAVLVGATTALEDNPRLTVRAVKGRNPVRVVLDGRLRVTPRLKMFNTEEGTTLVLTTQRAAQSNQTLVNAFEKRGVKVIALRASPLISPESILRALAREGISSVLIEGGGHVIAQFLEAERWNKLHLFVAPKILGEGKRYFVSKHHLPLSKARRAQIQKVRTLGDDLLIEGYPVHDRRQ